ncbi:MAG: type II secretion system minor pseudopilin GspK [Gammaproteobacteria bacterium]
MINPTNQRGAAIIVALFITALVAAAALAMITRFQTDTHRTELLLNSNQENLIAQGSIFWAFEQLRNDIKQQQPGKIIDKTPIRSPTDVVNGAKVYSTIFDAQVKLNLNNLSDSQFQTVFTRLIQLASPKTDLATAQTITRGVMDWITPGISNSSFDQYYATLKPPYRSAHQPMISVSELRMIQGVNAEIFQALLPYVTVLPEKTKININSAPIPVVMSLSPAITLETAQALDTFRRATPFVSLDNLANFTVVKSSPIAQNNLTVSSNYFMIKTHVMLGDQHAILYSLVIRGLKDSQPNITILWQSKGTL